MMPFLAGTTYPNTQPTTSQGGQGFFSHFPGNSVRLQANVDDPGRYRLIKDVIAGSKIPHVILMPPNEEHPMERFTETLQMMIEVLDQFPEIQTVELGNEPCYHTTQSEYADFVNHLAPHIRKVYPTVEIAVAFDFISDAKEYMQGGKWWDGSNRFFSKTVGLSQLLDWDLFDLLAIHPYRRNLAPSVSPIAGTREKEWLLYKSRAHGKQLIVTESGYNRKAGLTDVTIGVYTRQELESDYQAGCVGSFIYNWAGDYGVMNDDLSPRPSYTAIQQFCIDHHIG